MAQKRFTAVTQGVRRLTRAEQTEKGESKMAKVLNIVMGSVWKFHVIKMEA